MRILATFQGLTLLERKTPLTLNARKRMQRSLPHQTPQGLRPCHLPHLPHLQQLQPTPGESPPLLLQSTPNCPARSPLLLSSPRRYLKSWQGTKGFRPHLRPKRAGLQSGGRWLLWPLDTETTHRGTDMRPNQRPRSTASRATSAWPTARGRTSIRPSPRPQSMCRSAKPRSWPTSTVSPSSPWGRRRTGPRGASPPSREASLPSRASQARPRRWSPREKGPAAPSSPEACRQNSPCRWPTASRAFTTSSRARPGPSSPPGRRWPSVRTRPSPADLHPSSQTAARQPGSGQARSPGLWGSDPKVSLSSSLAGAPQRRPAGRPCGSSASWRRTYDGVRVGAGEGRVAWYAEPKMDVHMRTAQLQSPDWVPGWRLDEGLGVSRRAVPFPFCIRAGTAFHVRGPAPHFVFPFLRAQRITLKTYKFLWFVNAICFLDLGGRGFGSDFFFFFFFAVIESLI